MTAMDTEARLSQPRTEARLNPAGIALSDVETTDSLSMLKGRAVPYNVDADIGWFIERFAPGSLKKSIEESARALPLLLFHENRSWPIGAAHEYHDNNDGLDTVWRLDNSPEAQRAARLARDGMLNFLSIRFTPVTERDDWTYAKDFNPDLGAAHKDRVTRHEARLLETSLVSTPAYGSAAVEWVRTSGAPLKREQPARELREWRHELERLKRC